jgi:hypothetical protein
MNELFNTTGEDLNLLERIEDKVMDVIDKMTSSFTEKDYKKFSLNAAKMAYKVARKLAPNRESKKQVKALYKSAKALLK